MTTRHFPKDFLWGAATAAFQIEGATKEDGRGESIWDRFCATPGKVLNGDTGDPACDHYHRWREDIALMKDLGLQAYRFSIAWPRIIPDGTGQVNQRGLDFYDRLVDGLLEAGIQPYATLYHWDLPQALQDRGGWASRDTAHAFARYADVTARRLGDRVKGWITHNEPWCASILSYWIGEHAPGLKNGPALEAAHHLLLSHGLAMPAIRAAAPRAEAGITLNFSPAHPASDSEADVAAARRHDGFFNRWFADPLFKGSYPEDMVALYARLGAAAPVQPGDMETIAAPIDFLGVNYYNRAVIQDDPGGPGLSYRSLRPEGEYTHMDWEVYPDALRELLVRLHRDYAPAKMYITENGAAYPDELSPDGRVHDAARTRFLERHFAATHQAIAEGAPVAGFFVWSLMDNFEWAWGYSRRFGIVYVDYETQRRTPKDSAHYYRGVIAANGV
ncbi:MAG TPA: GH1 family beta-glucosidase [Roseiflexaceae bacterium]|nr:GH1 family beta-glucosidase [Roseiflexaceae bacterium]